MWKKALILALVLILLGLPLAVRWLTFYEGGAIKRDVPRPNLGTIEVLAPEMVPFVDRYGAAAPGTVLVDTAHENSFEMSELSVLRTRLSARGQHLEAVETKDDLVAKIRYANALVVISPGESYEPDEVELVQAFVNKGGRLLLMTDPTRFSLRFDDYGYVVGRDSDVTFVNDLVAQFGLAFQADYLYNTAENEGNFRNIRLTDFTENALTEGLDQVVFYAAHSIVADEPALITAGGETRSSNSERAEELAVAVLAADGAVLALGDLTFMTEPHNAVYDNDRLVANVADFLSNAQRRYELADFPFFFGDEVDLVYAGAPLLDSDFLRGGGFLQVFFADKGKALTVREEENQSQDTLFLGLYAYSEELDPYLSAAGVTLVFTPTQVLEEEAESETIPLPSATAVVTPSVDLAPSMTDTLGMTFTLDISATAAVSPVVGTRMEIASLGPVVVTGTALLSLQTYGERQVLVALAHTQTGLDSVVDRLSQGDLEDCLTRETTPTPDIDVVLCPTGEVAAGSGDGGWPEPGPEATPTAEPTPVVTPTLPITDTIEPPEPVGEPEESIIIVSFDTGVGRYDSMTSAEDYTAVLEELYDVTVWSVAQEGLPEVDVLLEYDVNVFTTGDFEDVVGDEESDLLFAVVLEGKPVILSGAFIDETAETAVQRDIQVGDATHPVARGFLPGEVIPFVPAPSGIEYEISVLEADLTEESTDVFVRGPDSEAPGASSITVTEDEILGLRVAVIGFPLYLLPQGAKTQLVLNTVDWLLAGAE